ncbi:MAG: hypothetical protein M1829_004477 [Trizodia sp. TS-e1964]|nr:MAG: hypothetical protein M1829_004477 [Trizodia sp. TS-e1964]
MAKLVAHRRNGPVARRARNEDEGEEESSLGLVEIDDDSQSEASLSDEECGDADGSDNSDDDRTSVGPAQVKTTRVVGRTEKSSVKPGASSSPKQHTARKASNPIVQTTDTEVMLNGFKPSDQAEAEVVEFKDLTDHAEKQPTHPVVAVVEPASQDTQGDKRRREHDEYKKKRDADPAFVPNRGAFFMHDHRHAGPAANGFRPFGRGRGKGRGGIGGAVGGVVGSASLPPNQHVPQVMEPTDAPWEHDMHEKIKDVQARPSQISAANEAHPGLVPPGKPSTHLATRPALLPPSRSFSKTTLLGNVQVRVTIQGVDKPIVFPAVPVNQYTCLPHHRPPLRRDKPVRISLPEHLPRYIFPSTDRSFIFIPRAMRPNQQSYGRGRGRSGHAGYSSRHTSIFGASVYSPSVAISRRSSLMNDISREGIISPVGSTFSRQSMKPVVKLPPTAFQPQGPSKLHGAATTSITQIVNLPPGHFYAMPQKPTYRENRPSSLPMHQPRPQKSVSVADIESPASQQFQAPMQQFQQSFHHQMHVQALDTASYNVQHSRHPSYPSHPSTHGTPLSQIPERAVHAQVFQPVQPAQYQHPHQPGYYPQYPVPHGSYYYPADVRPPPYSSAISPSALNAPVFVPGPPQEQQFAMPGAPIVPASGAPAAGQTVAQESNGMVYYYDSSQLPAQPVQPIYSAAPYPAPVYPMPQLGGVVGMGGMMTPSPDGYYYPQPAQGAVYYTQ